MSRVMRPLLILLLIFAIGIFVIYLDQTKQIPWFQNSNNPTVTPTGKPSNPGNNPQDPYNKLQ